MAETPRSVDPIAIVGLGCRFPGGVAGPESFWRVLRDGVDAISEWPENRARLDDAHADARLRWGGFLDQVDQFDAAFFRISPREALRMDPQQRLLLEVAWEALEDAGQVPERLSQVSTGVFIGIASYDHGALQLAQGTRHMDDPYAGTGSALSIAANRLSYVFDLHGPSLSVDTACSSSLVAVHLACQHLRAGECDVALAGGVNLMLTLAVTVSFSRAGFLAADGRCKSFDDRADGYVRGEGCGVVVLKRLEDAIADGDPIHAVIRGSAVNQDGRSNGLTAPNRFSQVAVLQSAYRAAGISPGRVQYVEAHGTGTPLGDPIEAAALGSALGVSVRDEACAIGSVKTNIGHLEAASGIAGLIKTVLALRHREIPPSLHFEQPNRNIPFEALRLRVPQRVEPWPENRGGRRLAGVSAFGFGGTNAHIVLEEAPERPSIAADDADDRAHVLPISARSAGALRALASAYVERLSEPAPPVIGSLCRAAATRRTHHVEHRLAVVGSDAHELASRLAAARDALIEPAGATSSRPAIVFVFPGQGIPYAGMARRLLATEPVFADAVVRCDELFAPGLGGWSVRRALEEATGENWDQTVRAQPLLFTVQVALAALWRSWGVEPSAVIGHSLGEIAASHVAGALDLDDAVRVVTCRATLMQRLHGCGGMVAVSLSGPKAQDVIRTSGLADQVSIAALNAPASTVLAGAMPALERLTVQLQASGATCTFLPVRYAFHGPEMAALAPSLRAALARISPRCLTTPMVSTVTGTRATDGQFDADYWARAMAEPVRFASALNAVPVLIARRTEPVFLDVGPRATLTSAIAATCPGATVLPSLHPRKDDRTVLLGSLAEVYTLGLDVAWPAVQRAAGPGPSLPTYPWQWEAFRTPLIGETDNRGDVDQRTPADSSERHAPSSWLYEMEWQLAGPRVHEEAATMAESDRPWLILADGGGEAEALAHQLGLRGDRWVIASAGTAYEHRRDRSYVVRAGCRADIQSLLADLAHAGVAAVRGVVHLRSLDAVGSERLTPGAVESAQRLGCVDVVHLVQELIDRFQAQAPPLWLITKGAQPAGPDPQIPGLAQAPLWGLGRVIAEEHPELRGGLIDLDPAAMPGESAALIAEALTNPSGEDQVAFRGGQRYVAALVRRPDVLRATGALSCRRDRTYLVAGGTGAVGLAIAQRLAERGAARLVLMGRTAWPPRSVWNEIDRPSRLGAAIDAVREIERLGASVHVATVDITDDAQVSAFLEAFRREGWPPFGGVVHAAGIANERLLLQLDADAMSDVLRPKLIGGWVLHERLRDEPLDFHVLISSAASILGAPGQAAYSAANAFMDGLAHYRRSQRLPALIINWAMWSDLGLAATEGGTKLRKYLAQRGVGTLDPGAALDVLEHAMNQSAPQIAVMPVDWTAFCDAYPPGREPRVVAALRDDRNRSTDARRVAAAVAMTRLDVERLVRDQVAGALAMEASRVGPQAPFDALGMDSMTGLELRDRLETSTGLALPATLAWSYPNAAVLSAYLAERMGIAHEPQADHGSARSHGREDEQTENALLELLDLTTTLSDVEFDHLVEDARIADGSRQPAGNS